MAFRLYLKNTMSKGNLQVKLIKSFRYAKHLFFRVFNVKVGNYPEPPDKISTIGFFDKDRKIHADSMNQAFFDEVNLYNGGEYIEMKPGEISIVRWNRTIMIRKAFSGVQKFNRFYHELVCLHRLQGTGFVPKIRFIDYSGSIIYMDYIDGFVVGRLNGKEELYENVIDLEMLMEEGAELLTQIHNRGVLLYDLKGTNMIIKGKKLFFFDFGDSVYFGRFLSLVLEEKLQAEKRRLSRELGKYIT